jgi:hypothetical protein
MGYPGHIGQIEELSPPRLERIPVGNRNTEKFMQTR